MDTDHLHIVQIPVGIMERSELESTKKAERMIAKDGDQQEGDGTCIFQNKTVSLVYGQHHLIDFY